MTEDNINSFISLKAVLKGSFEKSFDELPEDLQKRVERGFRPCPWEQLTPEERRARAEMWDGLNDPAIDNERRRLWELAGIERIAKIEEQIETWEAADDKKASDLKVKLKKLKKLKKKLRKAQEQCDRVLGSGTRTGKAPVTPKTNRDKKLQAEANNLAKARRKVNTRIQKGDNSLSKKGGAARAALYAPLRQQAIKLYNEGQFDSKRQASKDLYQPIKTYAYNKKIKVSVKPSTIYGWLPKASSTGDT